MGHSGRGRGRRRARAVDSPAAPSAARFGARTAPSGGDVEPAFRFKERRPGFPPDPNNQVWIFRFCFFSRVCREDNFPARGIRYFGRLGSRRVQPRLPAPPGKRAIYRFRFLSTGCKEENFPAIKSGGVSARKESRRFGKTWPRSAIFLSRSSASRRPALIVAWHARPHCVAGPGDLQSGEAGGQIDLRGRERRVRRMRGPELNVRSRP